MLFFMECDAKGRTQLIRSAEVRNLALQMYKERHPYTSEGLTTWREVEEVDPKIATEYTEAAYNRVCKAALENEERKKSLKKRRKQQWKEAEQRNSEREWDGVVKKAWMWVKGKVRGIYS